MPSARAVSRMAALLLMLALPIHALGQTNSAFAPPASTNWAGSVAIGLSVAAGNSDSIDANIAAVAEKKTPLREYKYQLDAVYGEKDGEQSEENVKGSTIWRRRLGQFYTYIDSSLLTDNQADIDYRATAGPGLGWRFHETEASLASIEGGFSYIREHSAGETTDTPAIRLAEELRHALSAGAQIWETAEYLPDIGDFSRYLINAEAGVESALNHRLSLRTFLKNTYDSRPAPGREPNDLALRVAFVYKI